MTKNLILACDLSLACPAFALVEANLTEGTLEVLKMSHVKTSSKKSTGFRLFQIAAHLEAILTENDIDEIVVEKGFSRFPTATQQIQRVVGVVTLFIYHHYKDKEIHEVAVTSVKKAVTGKGKATKEEVAAGLTQFVGELAYKTDDESDAVAVAVTLAKQKGWI